MTREPDDVIAERITRIHPRAACEGRHCCIHNPSPHHMAKWPRLWRDDIGLMERLCPHGIGHPDPDHQAYMRSRLGDEAPPGIHSCDGCCQPPG